MSPGTSPRNANAAGVDGAVILTLQKNGRPESDAPAKREFESYVEGHNASYPNSTPWKLVEDDFRISIVEAKSERAA